MRKLNRTIEEKRVLYRARQKRWRAENPHLVSCCTTWLKLLERCNNPKNNRYQWYGARGIQVLISRDDFLQRRDDAVFCEDCHCFMTDDNTATGKTVDRLDNDGDYTDTNIRFVCRSCNSKKAAKRKKVVYEA